MIYVLVHLQTTAQHLQFLVIEKGVLWKYIFSDTIQSHRMFRYARVGLASLKLRMDANSIRSLHGHPSFA
jgi:hypothetical protein